jgi:hypothetical protein
LHLLDDVVVDQPAETLVGERKAGGHRQIYSVGVHLGEQLVGIGHARLRRRIYLAEAGVAMQVRLPVADHIRGKEVNVGVDHGPSLRRRL